MRPFRTLTLFTRLSYQMLVCRGSRPSVSSCPNLHFTLRLYSEYTCASINTVWKRTRDNSKFEKVTSFITSLLFFVKSKEKLAQGVSVQYNYNFYTNVVGTFESGLVRLRVSELGGERLLNFGGFVINFQWRFPPTTKNHMLLLVSK